MLPSLKSFAQGRTFHKSSLYVFYLNLSLTAAAIWICFSEVMILQSKFEQDKKRIQQLRAARKFRPYWSFLLDFPQKNSYYHRFSSNFVPISEVWRWVQCCKLFRINFEAIVIVQSGNSTLRHGTSHHITIVHFLAISNINLILLALNCTKPTLLIWE